jgi:hypothetical protein
MVSLGAVAVSISAMYVVDGEITREYFNRE